MTSNESPPRTILCEEVFDENSQPSEEEVREYAIRIGIQPDAEAHLLPLARDGLMKALPSGWTPCFDHKKKAWYYFNYDTGMSQWEHPLDGVYRDLVRKNRSEMSISSAGEDDSKTSNREELKSFEEAAGIAFDPLAKQRDFMKPSGTLLRRATTQLAPIKKLPSWLTPVPLIDESKQKFIPRPPPSPTPSSCTETVNMESSLKKPEKHPKSMHGRTELTLSGGGTSFLKKPITPSSDSSLSEDHAPLPVWLKPALVTQPRGILRDKSPQRMTVTDMSSVDDLDKLRTQRRDLEEERKSVRFNLEDGLQIRFLEEDDDDVYAPVELKRSPVDSVTICLHPPESELESVDDGSNSEEEEVNLEDSPAISNAAVESKRETSKLEPSNSVATTPLDTDALGTEQKEMLISDMDARLMRLKEHLQREEELAIKTAHKEKEEKLTMIRESIQHEIQLRETNIREGAERTLEQLKEELASSMEQKLSAMQTEQKIILSSHEEAKHKLKLEQERELEALQQEFSALLASKKETLKEENCTKLDQVRKEMVDEYDRQICELTAKLQAEKSVREETLRAELECKESRNVEDLKGQQETNLKNRLAELEDIFSGAIEAKRKELSAAKIEKMDAMQAEMEEQLRTTRERLTENHNKLVDKAKMEQLVTFETLRGAMKWEEEELQAAHNAKISALCDKLNAEYEARLKRIKDAADKKTRLLEEQEERATVKFEQHGTVASLSRAAVDADNNTNYPRDHLQRQIELLSIKLRESRRQLEEARASRPDDRVFEKLRCEKRLLEDKYRTLKDKYVRLKSDIKQSLEKRNKKRLAAESHRVTGGSETDRSSSQKHSSEKQKLSPPELEEKAMDSMPEESEANNNTLAASSSHKESLVLSPPPTDSSDRTSPPPPVALRRTKRHQSKLKSSSTPRLDHHRESGNPVENLRTQLKKLEDLEDLFPASTHTDTYLRYPFSDAAQIGSCELEFFRHRIHLERDSVQRAKEFLRQQRRSFASRQRELRQRQAQANGEPPMQPPPSRLHAELLRDSIIQEERELSDMEVSLHRTRSLLGEKIIRLRQLEHSLRQASNSAGSAPPTSSPKVVNTDATLSDLSSHSGSSGFSSNESPLEGPPTVRNKIKSGAFNESADIAQSLETLNTEIRSLWDLLQRQNGEQFPPGPPPLLIPGSKSPWPALTTLAEQLQQIRLQQQVAANSSTVISSGSALSLAERAQGLRDWLRRARLDSAQLAPST